MLSCFQAGTTVDAHTGPEKCSDCANYRCYRRQDVGVHAQRRVAVVSDRRFLMERSLHVAWYTRTWAQKERICYSTNMVIRWAYIIWGLIDKFKVCHASSWGIGNVCKCSDYGNLTGLLLLLLGPQQWLGVCLLSTENTFGKLVHMILKWTSGEGKT